MSELGERQKMELVGCTQKQNPRMLPGKEKNFPGQNRRKVVILARP